jgi:hypothetical protein
MMPAPLPDRRTAMRLPALAAALLLVPPAQAQTLAECDWVASPANLVEPWEGTSRTFANGAIRIALLDTGEPACCFAHLLILSPSGEVEGPGYRACHVLSDTGQGLGFAEVDLAGIVASYDPARGLRLDVPVWRYIDGVSRGRPARVAVRINQATGAVTLE